jgi:tetratricopeptide (TPR) repeat protein
MQRCLEEDVVLAFVGGRLPEDVVASIEHHADRCAACLDLIAAAAGALTHEAPTKVVGEDASPAEVLGAPKILGGYRILDVLGCGGAGIVYQAVPVTSGDAVALKTIHSPARHAIGSIQREIRALSRLDHPGVVRVLDQGVEDGRPWYAMELVAGRTLDEHLRALHKSAAPPSAERRRDTLRILEQLCNTLGYVHGQGVVHRDLTPRNVVIRPDGAPVLVDFGLALGNERPGRDLLESATLVGGTVAYMAPEQIRGEILDPRADLYALGCMLYQTVTGRPPFDRGQGMEQALCHLRDAPEPPSARVPGLEPELEVLILKLLEKRSRDRVGYAEDVAAVLRGIHGTGAPEPDAEARPYVYRPGFCGRARQMEELAAVLERGQQGSGGLVLVAGASGIGKTRLVAEVASRAFARGFRVIAGECVAISTTPSRGTERSTALSPLRPLLAALAEEGRSSRERAERLVGPRGRVLAAFAPELLALPGQEAYPEPPRLPAEAARERLYEALRVSLEAFAAEATLLLVLDDLQWADELSLGFLETLPEMLQTRGIVVVGAYRSEEASSRIERLAGAPAATRLALEALDATSVEAMVGDMLSLGRVPEQLVRPLYAASEGSPFFVAEFLRAAVDERCLRRAVGATFRFAFTEGGVLPGTLHDLVARRLAALSADARRMAEVAAVLGRASEGDLLLAATGLGDAEGMDAMKELALRAILEESGGDRVRFVHDKLREVTYSTIPEARRRDLHGAVATTIERRRTGASLPPFHAALAHHWACAGIAERAVAHVERAGEHALATAAYAEAAGFYERALELSRGSGSAGPDPLRAARWRRRIAEAYYALGDLPRCEEHASRALDGFGHPLPRSRAGWTAFLCAELGRQLGHLALPGRAEESAPSLRAREEEAALAAARIAHHYYFVGDALALGTVSLLSVNLAERAGAADRLSRPYAQLGYFAGVCRLRPLAERYFARARRGARATSDPNALIVVLFHEATYHVGEGRWDLARRAGAQATELLEEVKNPQESEIVQTILAHADYCTGRYGDSITRCDAIFASARARANYRHRAWGLYAGARSLVRLGRLDEALERLDRAEDLLHEQPETPSEIICLGLRAAAQLRRGEPVHAEAAADRALERIERVSSPIFSLGDGYAGVAEVYLALLEQRGATGTARDSLASRARRAIAALGRFALAFPIGGPAALLAGGRAHGLTAGPRRAARDFERARGRAEALGMPFEAALARLHLARLPGVDPASRAAHLAAAGEVFERLGCTHWAGLAGAGA